MRLYPFSSLNQPPPLHVPPPSHLCTTQPVTEHHITSRRLELRGGLEKEKRENLLLSLSTLRTLKVSIVPCGFGVVIPKVSPRGGGLLLEHKKNGRMFGYKMIKYRRYLSITTGSEGVSLRFPQLFLSQQRLHITSCVSSTRHISGFLSWPS